MILGKANLSEWANFRSTSSSSGWSGAGGQTNNPYVLDRNPCGSSSRPAGQADRPVDQGHRRRHQPGDAGPSPAAASGFPSITVPAGFSGPLPVGVSFIGSRFGEADLVTLAFAFEKGTRVRRPPEFLPTVGR